MQIKSNQIPNNISPRKICGILGSINLISGNHLVVATHRIFVGKINGQIIWRLAGIDIIPYIPSLLHLNDSQVKYLAGSFDNLVDNNFFFFRKNKTSLTCR